MRQATPVRPGEVTSPGNPLPLETLFDQFGAGLKAFVQSRVKNPEITADLTQEIWLKVHERLPTLRDTARVESWLFRIARNAIVDHSRRVHHSEELPEELATDLPEPELPDLRPTIVRFLDRLPAEDREALRLTEYEGLSQRELATRLGLSLSGAKSRVHRARSRLSFLLDQCCRFEFDRRGKVIEAIPRSNSEADSCGCP